MEGYELRFFDAVAEVPWWWLDALLAWLGIMGLLLWVLGRKLARPALVLAGLGVGAAVALAGLERYAPEARPMVWVIAGAVVGAVVLGGLLWRVALALTLTAIAAVAAPWAVAIVTGIEEPPIREPIAAAIHEARQAAAPSTGTDEVADPDPPGEEADADTADATDAHATDEENAPPSITDPIVEGTEQAREAAAAWWNELPPRHRYWLIGTAVGAALAALLIGLAMPRLTASLVTALLGVILMLAPAQRIVGLLPQSAADAIHLSPTTLALTLLTATLVGVVLQWMIFRKAKD